MIIILAALASLASASAEPLLPQLPAATVHYARPEAARSAVERVEGRLRLDDSAGATMRVIRDDFGRASALADSVRKNPLPDFAIDLMQAGGTLVPVKRGVVEGDHPLWDLIVEPGAVWADAGGATIGAVPFALQERNANCTHYGLLLFRLDGAEPTGDAAWQIGSETCAYFQFDAWGRATVGYVPGKVPPSELHPAAGNAGHLDAPLAIDELARVFPAVGKVIIPEPVKPSAVTSYGLVVDGKHFASSCPTRFGPHPYCGSLPLPSYSLAKSLFGGLGLMRAELLRPGTMRRTIAPLVPACADWGEVTLEHALDMATGRYASPVYDVDESGSATISFLESSDHPTRILLACTAFERREAPARRWVYHTTDTYVLGAALTALSAPGDIHRDLLVEPIWRELGLSPLSAYTRRTRDAVRQPFVGYGLTFQRNDLVRIAQFLQAGGSSNGKVLVDQPALAAAMQRNSSDRGLEAGFPGFRYQNGFWARDIAKLVGCAQPVWAPFLSGYGGISLVLFPNGISYYVVSDSHNYDWSEAVKMTHRIRSLCPAAART